MIYCKTFILWRYSVIRNMVKMDESLSIKLKIEGKGEIANYKQLILFPQ